MSEHGIWRTRNPERLSALRQVKQAILLQGLGLNSARWELIETGLTVDEVHQAERIIRREVAEERGVTR